MRIEVVLAMPGKQELVELNLAEASTVRDAIEQSDIVARFEGFELDERKVGVFGQKASMDQALRAGDRVEIYRDLLIDPKELRRQRAIKQGV